MKMSELKTMGVWGIIMLIFIAQLLFYTWCRVQCVQVGYEITKETDNHQKLITLQNKLKIELARLKSPERIAKIAKNELGLATPTPEQMVIIP
ncbi:septum formation initiator family protein [Desulfonema magnum]|uniref:Cell division protein FtsL domain-containing protein n=1 Tax=Desulfonema magnum TaxID=45655 RepID=A0A975BEX7_9BACT|nr:cell division protein FtsL [Desulfonema magnum]QTA84053.1 Cell division protein FtsL domain-containing protein [Desulfonema magnum]